MSKTQDGRSAAIFFYLNRFRELWTFYDTEEACGESDPSRETDSFYFAFSLRLENVFPILLLLLSLQVTPLALPPESGPFKGWTTVPNNTNSSSIKSSGFRISDSHLSHLFSNVHLMNRLEGRHLSVSIVAVTYGNTAQQSGSSSLTPSVSLHLIPQWSSAMSSQQAVLRNSHRVFDLSHHQYPFAGQSFFLKTIPRCREFHGIWPGSSK